MMVPRHKWEVTFQDKDDNWCWYWTEPMTFREAVLDALGKEQRHFRNCDLIAIRSESELKQERKAA